MLHCAFVGATYTSVWVRRDPSLLSGLCRASLTNGVRWLFFSRDWRAHEEKEARHDKDDPRLRGSGLRVGGQCRCRFVELASAIIGRGPLPIAGRLVQRAAARSALLHPLGADAYAQRGLTRSTN